MFRLKRVFPSLTTDLGLLYNVDCLLLLSAIKDNKVDCVFADPPFNLGKKYGALNDNLSKREYLDWSSRWLSECSRVLKPGGSLFVYILPRWGYHFATFLDSKLVFKHWISLIMKGTYPRGRRLYPAHYALLYFTKGEPTTFNHIRIPIQRCRHCGKEIKDYGGHRRHLNPSGVSLSDFWEDTSPNRHKHNKFRKANELNPIIPERAILTSTRKRNIVLDPFGGGGSSYEICQRLQRYWIGSEISDCSPIFKRLKERFPSSIGKKPPKAILRIFKFTSEDFAFELK